MAIAVACQCGHGFEVKDELQGQVLTCPKCRQPVHTDPQHRPNGSTTRPANGRVNGSGRKSRKSDLIAISCGCGKRIAAKREWAGRRLACPSCGEALRVPAGVAEPAPVESDLESLLEEVGIAKADQRCPECRAVMKVGDVICLQCGYDLERGKKLRTKTYQSSARKLDMQAGAAPQRSNTPLKIAVAVLLGALLIVAALLVPKLMG